MYSFCSEWRVAAVGARLREWSAGAAHEHSAAVADARGEGLASARALAAQVARVRAHSHPTRGHVAHQVADAPLRATLTCAHASVEQTW